MTPQQTVAEINTAMRLAIEAGLCDQQRYPAMRKVGRDNYVIYIEGSPELSASLKDRSYADVYLELAKSGAYNLLMIDGALIQMMYSFENNEIASHRLCVFPSPDLDLYERSQELYESDELYADIVEKNAIRFPLRFDFSNDDARHVDPSHPKSHLTLGQYTNCRIPVASPLTPAKFISFVLRVYYSPAVERLKFANSSLQHSFAATITDNEKKIGYFTY